MEVFNFFIVNMRRLLLILGNLLLAGLLPIIFVAINFLYGILCENWVVQFIINLFTQEKNG